MIPVSERGTLVRWFASGTSERWFPAIVQEVRPNQTLKLSVFVPDHPLLGFETTRQVRHISDSREFSELDVQNGGRWDYLEQDRELRTRLDDLECLINTMRVDVEALQAKKGVKVAGNAG